MNETVNKAQRHGRDKFVEINKWNSEMNVQKVVGKMNNAIKWSNTMKPLVV